MLVHGQQRLAPPGRAPAVQQLTGAVGEAAGGAQLVVAVVERVVQPQPLGLGGQPAEQPLVEPGDRDLVLLSVLLQRHRRHADGRESGVARSEHRFHVVEERSVPVPDDMSAHV